MTDPAIALVFSPEPWVERLHRHCADHGGAYVRQIVLDPQLCFEEEFDTLVASHRWPALTPGLVEALHERGRHVVGVYDDQRALDHIARAGVDAVLATDAPMGEFVAVLRDLGALGRRRREPTATPVGVGLGSVAVGGPGGAGATEVAVELARQLAAHRPTVLVDADDVAPSIAARLGLALEPNVRTALDAAVFRAAPLELTEIDSGFGVLGGVPSVTTWSHLRPEEVRTMLRLLASEGRVVVANVGNRLESTGEPQRYGLTRTVVAHATVVVGVIEPSPVGVIRAREWCAAVRDLNATARLDLMVGRVPRDSFGRHEIEGELTALSSSVTFTPEDARVRSAAWEGSLVRSGPFTKSLRTLSRALTDVLGSGDA